MPCPHFSGVNGECVLQQADREAEDDAREAQVEDPVERDWCLSADKGYRDCPVYRSFLAELVP
jgi:hypothetical protein